MSALVAGYEYDIFISYRQKDNKGDQWVTAFVNALKTELEATFKEDISIYFDSNPHDGLLETHDVDESLKDKLKCLIFIPIISQTYCDQKSFAWKNEFLAFKKIASADQFGLKIKLANGNVASRILPISIHELDTVDKQLVEAELEGVLRGIEFIYRSAGVVRPLKAFEEDVKANLNHTFYRDQINKVARAVKELAVGIQTTAGSPHQKPRPRPDPKITTSAKRKITLAAAMIGLLGLFSFTYYYFGGFGNQLNKKFDKSIAVLPFENMNHDPEQDYFSNGIAEDILNHLTKISDLKVKSRTSTLQYKGTQKSIPEIGEELSVGNIVEGSVRRVGDKVRVVVQLIDAKTDIHLWSETYDRELKNVLALQSEIAIEIARALEARLTAVEKKNIQKEVSQNVEAYDYFLKGREIFNNTNYEKREFENSLLLINQALKLDSGFSRAFALKAQLWYGMRTFGVSQKTWQDSAMYFSSKAISLDPSSPDGYLVQGYVYGILGKLKESTTALRNAYHIAPNDPAVLSSYGFQLLGEKDERGADLFLKSIENQFSLTDPRYYLMMNEAYYYAGDISTQEKLIKKAKSLNPGSISPYRYLAFVYTMSGQYEKGIHEVEEAEKINPKYQWIVDQLGWLHYLNNDLNGAAKYWIRYSEIETTFEDSTQILPFRHRLGMVYSKMGRKKEADALFGEDLKFHSDLLSGKRGIGSWSNYGAVYYGLAVDHAYFGNNAKAVQCLDSAFHYGMNWEWGYHNDPMFSNLRNRGDFKSVMKKIDDQNEFQKRAFSNAINRMDASKELKNVLK